MPISIVVVGNCQVVGIANCVKRLVPYANVATIFVGHLRSQKDVERAAGVLNGADFVFSNTSNDDRYPSLSRPAVQQQVGMFLSFPRFFFNGFHPDMSPELPIPNANSALAVGCFLCGLPEDQVVELFNAYIYDRLGYFEAYPKSMALLERQEKKHDLSLVPLIPEWQRDGAFMHTYNHPHVVVLWSIAKAVCEKAGLSIASDAILPEDNLATKVVWPVYPEIARRIGVPGGSVWRTAGGGSLNLKSFVATCYTACRAVGAARLRIPRVDEVARCISREIGCRAPAS